MPGIFEGGDLGFGSVPAFVGEEDVVGAVGVEGWIEVDQVDGFVGDVFAEDIEIVPVEQGVLFDRWMHCGFFSCDEGIIAVVSDFVYREEKSHEFEKLR